MLTLNQLGHAIAQRRKSLRLTQSELAQRADISRRTLHALEHNRLSELGFNKINKLLAPLHLEFRIGEAGKHRPTLDDLLREEQE